MTYSEKNYQENINNKNLKFLSLRRDGFGARMVSLLNAMYCSKKFNFPFAFLWSEVNRFLKKTTIDGNKLTGIYYGKAEDVFSEDFIKKYLLTDEDFFYKKFYDIYYKNMGLTPYILDKNFHFEDLLYYEKETPLGWVMPHFPLYALFKDINKDEYRQIIRQCWEEIILSRELCEIKQKIDSAVQNKGKFIAIHVRSGDIVYQEAFHLAYKNKALVAELAVEVIVRELPHHNIVLLGDDITSLQRMREFSLQFLKEKNIDCNGHSIILAKDLINNEYDELKLVFYDSYVLSRAYKIYTSTYSAFSDFSIIISRAENSYSCYEYFSKEEQCDITKKYVEKLNLHPAQKAFSYLHLMLVSHEIGKPVEEQLAYADKVRSLANLTGLKLYYALFLLYCSRADLFYQYINSLSLEEVEKIVKSALYPDFHFQQFYLKRFFIGIMTAENVRKAHLFSKIKKSFTEEEKEQFDSVGFKMKFKFFYHDLLNLKIHD